MKIYGEECVEIRGKVLESESNFAKIIFLEQQKTLYVPKYLIHHAKNYNGGEKIFHLPKWFLIRQRILPLQVQNEVNYKKGINN